MATRDKRIDAAIAKARPFARPILQRLRAAVHAGCPDVEETLKWSRPSFTYRGSLLCGMADFKAHCTFGFWKDAPLRERLKAADVKLLDALGRIETANNLPPDATLKRLVAAAAKLEDDGVKLVRKVTPASQRNIVVPPDLAAALKRNAAARATFQAFSYSHKKEYVEWIEEARKDETRQRRVATALEWMSEGKSKEWRYQRDRR